MCVYKSQKDEKAKINKQKQSNTVSKLLGCLGYRTLSYIVSSGGHI